MTLDYQNSWWINGVNCSALKSINDFSDVCVSGSGRRLSGDRAHPGEQGSQDEETHLPSSRTHQPLHELALPHRDDPHREGADRPQARGGGGSEEKGTTRREACSDVQRQTCSLRVWAHVWFSMCCCDEYLGHLWKPMKTKTSTERLCLPAVCAVRSTG